MYDWWIWVLLCALSLLTGVASSTLAVSAYVTLLPLLLDGLELDPLSAIWVCLCVDALNGFSILFRYRETVTKEEHWPIVYGCLIAVTTAAALSATVGMDFIDSHGRAVGTGSSVLLFVMALGFCVKGSRIEAKEIIKHRRNTRLALHPVEGFDAGAEPGTGADIRPEAGAQPGGPVSSAVIVAVPSVTGEPHVEDKAAGFGSTPPKGRVKSVLSRPLLCGVSILDVYEVGFLIGTGAFAGMFGFGGGNAFAIMYMSARGWATVPSAAASGAISGLMTLVLLILFAAYKVVDFDAVKTPIAVALPLNAVAVFFTTSIVGHLSEKAVTLTVALLLLILAVAATIYAILK